jgi:hypothetical protein
MLAAQGNASDAAALKIDCSGIEMASVIVRKFEES